MTLRMRQAGGVLCVVFAFVCFSLMDHVQDYSPSQTSLQYGGYALCAVAAVLLLPILGRRA